MSNPITISGIYVLGTPLPIGNRNYCVARVTQLEGDLPDNINVRYPDGAMRATDPIDGEEGVITNTIALYVIVNISLSEPDENGAVHEVYEVVSSMDDFLSVFEFPDDAKREYIDYFFGMRSGQVSVAKQDITLYDEDSKRTSTGFVLYDVRELQCVNDMIEASGEDHSIEDIRNFIAANDLVQIRNASSIMLLFGEAMDKAVDLYNGINYHSKAKEIAELISNITYINQQGVKGPLNFTAVEKLFNNIKENLIIGGVRPTIQQPTE